MFMCQLNSSLIMLLMASYCSEQQEHGSLQLALGTAQHPVTTSGFSLDGKCGLSIVTIENVWSYSPLILWRVV